jgi:anti-sigma B factor antagonist
MEIQTTHLDDHVVVVRPQGRLNMVAAPGLKAAIGELIQAGSSRVVVDLSEVAFIDSSGLGALIAGLKTARQARGDLRIVGVADQVAAVLRLTNLDRVLRSHDTIEAAVDGW